MLTRKYFKELARIVAETELESEDTDGRITDRGVLSLRVKVMDMCQISNPGFDRARFSSEVDKIRQNKTNKRYEMYTNTNFKTKKAFKAAVESGEEINLFSPGYGSPKQNGTEYVEGPWYPEPHRWYAQVEVLDGKVVKVK